MAENCESTEEAECKTSMVCSSAFNKACKSSRESLLDLVQVAVRKALYSGERPFSVYNNISSSSILTETVANPSRSFLIF